MAVSVHTEPESVLTVPVFPSPELFQSLVLPPCSSSRRWQRAVWAPPPSSSSRWRQWLRLLLPSLQLLPLFHQSPPIPPLHQSLPFPPSPSWVLVPCRTALALYLMEPVLCLTELACLTEPVPSPTELAVLVLVAPPRYNNSKP